MQVGGRGIVINLASKRSLIGVDLKCYFLENVQETEGKQSLTSISGFCTTTQCQSKTGGWGEEGGGREKIAFIPLKCKCLIENTNSKRRQTTFVSPINYLVLFTDENFPTFRVTFILFLLRIYCITLFGTFM
jgi:hypothetical protein